MTPQAGQLATTETIADDLALRYSLRYVETRNPAIVDLYAFNHGLFRGEGTPSRTTLIFFAFQGPPPGSSFLIPQGTPVTTQDATITFQTIEDIEVSDTAIQLFFNAATRRFEIPVQAESVGIGPEFEIAANRLRNIVAPVEGIAGVFQPFATSPSSDVESTRSLGQRQQAKFVGLALGTPSGVESVLRDFESSRAERFIDVALVFSSDLTLFRRPTRRSAFDVYVIGSRFESIDETFVLIGGETSIVLNNQPVQNVLAMTINGVDATPTLLKDNSPSTQGSTSARDKLGLASPATAGDTIQVSYTFDALLNEAQNFILLANKRLWNADILLRQGFTVPIAVDVDITALSTFDHDRIRELTRQAIFSSISVNRFGLTYFPQAVGQRISATIAGLSNIVFRRFQRIDAFSGLLVDTVETKRNEYAIAQTAQVTVNVRT